MLAFPACKAHLYTTGRRPQAAAHVFSHHAHPWAMDCRLNAPSSEVYLLQCANCLARGEHSPGQHWAADHAPIAFLVFLAVQRGEDLLAHERARNVQGKKDRILDVRERDLLPAFTITVLLVYAARCQPEEDRLYETQQMHISTFVSTKVHACACTRVCTHACASPSAEMPQKSTHDCRNTEPFMHSSCKE